MADRSPAIPSINATVAPSGTPLPAVARPPQMIGTGGALQQLGNEFGNVSDTFAKVEVQKAQAMQDIWLSQAKSAAEIQSQKMLEDMQRKAQLGKLIAPEVQTEWEKNTNAQLEAVKDNPVLKARLSETFTAVGTNAMKAAQDFDYKQNDAYVAHNISDTINNKSALYSTMTDRDAISIKAQNDLGEMTKNINALPLAPDQREKLLDEMRKGIVLSAMDAKVAIDPIASLNENAPARSPESVLNDPHMPRGIRNNNPGNLKGELGFMGFKGLDDKGYGTYDTPEAGLRAMAINIRNQQDLHGLNTVADIVTKYAPPDENNTPAYIASVSKALGVKPDEKIDLHDPETLAKFMSASIKQENGTNPYSAKNIMFAAAQAAKPGTEGDNPGMARPDGGARTGDPLFSLLHPAEQQQVIQHMETVYRQQQYFNRQATAMASGMLDQVSEALKKGYPVDDEQIEQIRDMASQSNNPALTSRLTKLVVRNQSMRDFTPMTPIELQNYLQGSLKPLIDSGKASPDQIERFDTGIELLGTMRQQLKADPLGWYARTGAQVPQLNLADPAAMQQRVNVAKTVSNLYGTSPGAAFWTPVERDYVANAMAAQPVDGQMKTLKALNDNISDPAMYQSVIQQIRPDSPVTAMAGMYLGLGKNLTTATHWFRADEAIAPQIVAQRLLEGEALLNPTKADKQSNGVGKSFPMPSDTGQNGLRDAFNSYTGDAFRGQPQLADQAYQAYRAFYAAEAAHRGDYSGTLNDAVTKLASKAVIGNVVEKNGKNIIAPWGMDETTFNDLAKVHFDEAVKAHKLNPQKITWSNATLENTGEPDSYRAIVGAGYLMDENQYPIVLNVGKPLAAPAAPIMPK